MNKKKEILDELKDIAPSLSKMEKKNPFEVPANYFSQLPDEVLKKARQTQREESWIDRLDANIKYWLYAMFQPKYAVPVAISFLVIITGVSLFKAYQNDHDLSTVRMADISTQDIDDYLMDNYETDELLSLNDLDVSGFKATSIIPNDISTDELNEYIFNNIDEQTMEDDFTYNAPM